MPRSDRDDALPEFATAARMTNWMPVSRSSIWQRRQALNLPVPLTVINGEGAGRLGAFANVNGGK